MGILQLSRGFFLKNPRTESFPYLHFVDNFRAYVRFPTPHTHARPFELSGCEAFVVSGRSEDIGKYYAENEEMIFYDDIPDLIGKIRYYLSHDGEREKIADAGYGRTMREHTYENRFLDIFADVGLNYIRKK